MTLSSLTGSPGFFSKSGSHDFQFVFCGFYLVIYFPSFFFWLENGKGKTGGYVEAEIVGQAFRNGLATNASTKIFSFAGHDLSSTRLFDKRVIFSIFYFVTYKCCVK